jgi:hypothetical protein
VLACWRQRNTSVYLRRQSDAHDALGKLRSITRFATPQLFTPQPRRSPRLRQRMTCLNDLTSDPPHIRPIVKSLQRHIRCIVTYCAHAEDNSLGRALASPQCCSHGERATPRDLWQRSSCYFHHMYYDVLRSAAAQLGNTMGWTRESHRLPHGFQLATTTPTSRCTSGKCRDPVSVFGPALRHC